MGILECFTAINTQLIMSLFYQRTKHALIGLLLATAATAGFTSKTFAAAGDLFVSDLATNSILVYHPDGTKFTFASGLNRPFGLGFDGSGNLYEADFGSGRIYKFTADGPEAFMLPDCWAQPGSLFRRIEVNSMWRKMVATASTISISRMGP